LPITAARTAGDSWSVCEVRDQDAAVVHRGRKIKTRRDLAEDEPQVRRCCDLSDLVQHGGDRL
jgi:hypothetical protein